MNQPEKREQTPEKKRSRSTKDDSDPKDSLNETSISPFEDTHGSNFSSAEAVAPTMTLKKDEEKGKATYCEENDRFQRGKISTSIR